MNDLNIVYPSIFEILYVRGTNFLYFPINFDNYIVVTFT